MAEAGIGLLPGPRPLRAAACTGPLSGLTAAVKDLFDVAGFVTGAGNPAWAAQAVPAAADAEAVARLSRAGATMWAKAITDEFAYSLDGDNTHYGAPVNVRAPGRLPGGSSSGPAAAVAAGLADIGLGSDTAGSIRVPASYCGLYGYRPTHGVVPVTGVIPLAPSFDTVGVLAADLGILHRAGAALGAMPAAAAERDVRRFVVPAFLDQVADDEVQTRYEAVVRVLKDAGFQVTEWRGEGGLAPAELCSSYLALSRLEAWQSHGRWVAQNWDAVGRDVADRFRAASNVAPDSAAVREARDHRDRLRQLLARALDPATALMVPAAANVPLEIDTPVAARAHSREATIALCALAGLTGAPGVVIPTAAASELPIGMCLVALPGYDATAIAAARIVDCIARGRVRT